MPTGIPYKPNDADRLKLTHGLEFGLTLKFIAQNMGLSVNPLKYRYRDIIKAAELAGGNKFTPTEEQRKMVTLAAAVGLPHEDIAEALHVSRNTLVKYFGEELSLGALRANLKVASNLFKIATADPPQPGTVLAAIFWAKTRMRWRSTPAAERIGVYGAKIAAQVVVMPQMPTVPDCGEALPPDAAPTPTNPCEEALDIELYHANASQWHEVARATSDTTLHAAFTEVARAFERVAFLATRPANAAMLRPKLKPRAHS
jgi:hypothetical protein